ncbi:MAG: hypothetical protein CVU38_03850 [Chloroflexi bacterium HGW-Chloroflexi-1]|nr:MAG: hypothetical protein CVU38_03850 [Chloroflexi bacterium HGW-Chloroflexi-1]
MRSLIIAALLLLALTVVAACYPIVTPPGPTPEPLVPTPLPSSRATATPHPAPSPAAPSPAAPVTQSLRSGDRARVGVGLPLGAIEDYDWGQGAPGWYLNWRVMPDPPQPEGIRFAQMVRIRADGFRPTLDVITAAARANPGALWLIGNEPDVIWQDNATPEQYAASYGVLYQAIKAADPTAQVAIGGVSQPTPLRMAYLDRILAAYRAQYGGEMPVDVWNVHAFILREESDSWGVGIPPGMAVDRGQLYEISDHADMAIFRRQIEDFRRWMAERGWRDKQLIVTEYGVLMPESYGFPPELVGQFMTDTFDYFLTARDPDTGYPADDDRLVQAFCWYSVADTDAPNHYPTPNLFDPQTRAVTAVGEVFRDYVAGLR